MVALVRWVVLSLLLAIVACGGNYRGDLPDGGSLDACVGLECQRVDCLAQHRPETAISGTVLAPNGTLPLWGVSVYIPDAPTEALPEGARCSRWSEYPASGLAATQTDPDGRFRLYDVPAGADIPLVVKIGKWRRQITIPHVEACAETVLAAEATRLPRDHTEGDLPRIALTTGGHDALECLVRKLGVSDAEVTTDAGPGRVHLYAGTGGLQRLSGGEILPSATTLWSSVDKLRQYDLVLLSCEGAQHPETKPQAALDAMKAYADLGGRVYASHWHNIWIGGSFTGGGPTQPEWAPLAQWSAVDADSGPSLVLDERSNPLGTVFASWMLQVGGSTERGRISLAAGTGHATARSVDPAKVERWISTPGADVRPQLFQLTTPLDQSIDARCGKVLFTDIHVPDVPGPGGYPDACSGTTLTPQEKALAFTFFELTANSRWVPIGI